MSTPNPSTELATVNAALDLRRRLRADKLKQREGLLARIIAGGDIKDDVELASVNNDLANLAATLDALSARAEALEADIVRERRLARIKATERERTELIARAKDQVDLAAAVDAAGAALLQAFARYRDHAQQLREDTARTLKDVGLKGDEIRDALEAVGATSTASSGVLLFRALVAAAPGGRLDHLVLVTSGVYDGGPNFSQAAERDAQRAQHFLSLAPLEPANG